jgi:hypothetical protein
MELGKKLKDLVLSGFMSLSKAEQQMIRDVLQEDHGVEHEQQVKKDYIKLISPKRFYEILDRADEFISQRDKDKFVALMESRGLSETTKTFKNKIYTDYLGNTDWKFKTDNGLFQFANMVTVVPNNYGVLLTFHINTKEHPAIRQQGHLLTGLKQFQFTEGMGKYAYQISRFIEVEQLNPWEIGIVFEAKAMMDNVREEIIDDTERIMHKRDLLSEKNKTFYLGGGQDSNNFLLNG